MKKRVLVQGYFNGNFGDDLIVSSFVKRLSQENIDLIFLDNRLAWLKKDNHNVKIPLFFVARNKFQNKLIALSPNKFKMFLKKHNTRIVNSFIRKNVDVVLQIGGSMFQENSQLAELNKEKTISDIDYEVFDNTFLKPRIVMGCNFGPWHTEFFLRFYKEYFRRCKRVYFRESNSYNMFSQIESCEFSTDTAFLTSVESNLCETSKKVVVSVMDLCDKLGKEGNDNYLNSVCDSILSYHAKGYDITLVGFCKAEGDTTAINNVLSKIKGVNVTTLIYDNNLNQIIREFASAEVVFATRFHAMILSWLLKKKVYVFAYSQKTLNFIFDNGFPIEFVCDVTKNEDCSGDIIFQKLINYDKYVDLEKIYDNNCRKAEKMIEEFVDSLCDIK